MKLNEVNINASECNYFAKHEVHLRMGVRMPIILLGIKNNFGGDPHCGSINCRQDARTPILPEVYTENGKISMTSVLVPHLINNIKLEIQVQNVGVAPYTFCIQAEHLDGDDVLGNFEFPICTLNPGESAILEVLLTIHTIYSNGQLIKLSEKLQLICCYSTGLPEVLIQLAHLVYLLPNLPIGTHPDVPYIWNCEQEKYKSKETRYIWTTILDICCHACELYLEKTGKLPDNPTEYMAALSHELHFSGDVHYDIMAGRSFYTEKNGRGISIKLQKYIDDRKSPYRTKVNCSDCAAIVAAEALACGIAATTVIMRNTTIPAGGFKCNPIIPIGYNNWQYPFDGQGFSYHEVTTGGTVRDNTIPIYDACLQMDTGDYPWSAPTAQNKENYVSDGWVFSLNNNPDVHVDTTQPYADLTYRERLACDGASCWLDNIVYCIMNLEVMYPEGKEMPIEENAEWLDQIAARFGLLGEHLPEGEYISSSEDASILDRLEGVDSWSLCEDYGRGRGYKIRFEGHEYEMEIVHALSTSEARALLLTRLDGITAPHVERISLGDIAFSVDRFWCLFKVSSLIVQISSDQGDCKRLGACLLALQGKG